MDYEPQKGITKSFVFLNSPLLVSLETFSDVEDEVLNLIE
jgi:hypothetical protein